MPHRLFASFVVAPKPVIAGLSLFLAALGAGAGADYGGIIYALVGAVSGLAAGAVAYGVMRSQIAEHERRLDANDEAHDDFGEKLSEHTRAFTTFAAKMEGNIGELVGAARHQAATELKEAVKAPRRGRK